MIFFLTVIILGSVLIYLSIDNISNYQELTEKKISEEEQALAEQFSADFQNELEGLIKTFEYLIQKDSLVLEIGCGPRPSRGALPGEPRLRLAAGASTQTSTGPRQGRLDNDHRCYPVVGTPVISAPCSLGTKPGTRGPMYPVFPLTLP